MFGDKYTGLGEYEDFFSEYDPTSDRYQQDKLGLNLSALNVKRGLLGESFRQAGQQTRRGIQNTRQQLLGTQRGTGLQSQGQISQGLQSALGDMRGQWQNKQAQFAGNLESLDIQGGLLSAGAEFSQYQNKADWEQQQWAILRDLLASDSDIEKRSDSSTPSGAGPLQIDPTGGGLINNMPPVGTPEFVEWLSQMQNQYGGGNSNG